MDIGIDARLLEQPMTGIGRYLRNLIKHIPANNGDDRYFLFSYRSLPAFSGRDIVTVPTVSYVPRNMWQKFFSVYWMNVILPSFIKREKIDIFLSPNHFLPWRSASKRNIIVIHDVFQKVNKHFHSGWYRAYLSMVLSRAVRKSDMILTNSECSKRDIVRYLGVSEEKVRVIYEAAEEHFMPREISEEEKMVLQKRYGLPSRFIFSVGVIEERKNIAGIIRIADILLGRTDVPIVMVGRPGYRGAYYLGEISKRKNIRYLGAVSDEDLPILFNLASSFVFPSWYEGFGLPPLEAMQSGTPVIASNTSSLPEVVGEGGILLSPDDAEGFAKNILEILNNDGLARKIAATGILQAKKFSFAKMARETVDTLRAVGAGLKEM